MATEYYKKQLERGLIYQDFVYEILHRHGIATVAYGSKLFQQKLGENKARIEIKFDDKLKATGNLWIETQEKSDPRNADYVVSGIYRDCCEYVIGNYDVIYRMATTALRLVHQTGRYAERENGLKTSRGFLLPSENAARFAIAVYRVDCERQVTELLEADRVNKREAVREMASLLALMRCDERQGVLFDAPA